MHDSAAGHASRVIRLGFREGERRECVPVESTDAIDRADLEDPAEESDDDATEVDSGSAQSTDTTDDAEAVDDGGEAEETDK